MSERETKRENNRNGLYTLEFVGLAMADVRPDIVMLAVDSSNATLHKQEIGSDGNFTIPDDVLKRAHRVVLGASDGKGGIRAEASVKYRAHEFIAQIKDGTLALAEGIWSGFRYHWVCVNGSVQACRYWRWWFDSVIAAATTAVDRESVQTRVLSFSRTPAPALEASLQSRFLPSLNDLIYWPRRCAAVCLGSVEVYRRTCCCWPIVYDDVRIDDLIRDLHVYVEQLPKLPPPKRGFPPPPPPPGDPLKTPFFIGGGLNEMAINATNDLHTLRSLPRDQAAQYINSRAYLFHRLCSCGLPARVGSGTIQPDGSFNICWLEPWRLLLPNCYEQYAYVVKQTIGGSTRTIYDGLAAGAWFATGDQPMLTSYSDMAFTCNETGSGDGSAYVLLDLIGNTESHELTTPASTGWDRVAVPEAASGLLFPNAADSGGRLRNLGGGIKLTYEFSLGMRDASIAAPAGRPAGAHYYRVSVCRADPAGNPTGTRRYYNEGLAWKKIAGADIVPESLGPVSVGSEDNLYRIPYDDEPWVGDVRHHALIDTLQSELNVPADLPPSDPGYQIGLDTPASNHLITLEVFDAAGVRLRPLGTPASVQLGTEQAKPFKYRRWFQPAGSPGDDTVEVPYAALTHLFCWDNRRPVADITRLVMNGMRSDEECQFLHGPGTSTFAIEYRAYVPDDRFKHSHGIRWLRGLNGSATNGGDGALLPFPPPPPSPPLTTNVGKPSNPAINSGSNMFTTMLTRLDAPNPPTVLQRCSFAVTLTTDAKTTDGSNLNCPSVQETAAFALEIG